MRIVSDIKIGDKVIMGNNYYRGKPLIKSAYNGMVGVVTDTYDDGSFILNCGNSKLIVGFHSKKYVHIYLNDKSVLYSKIKRKYIVPLYRVGDKVMEFLLKKIYGYNNI